MASRRPPEPPPEAPPRPRPPADEGDFEQVERITRRVVAIGGRAVLVGLPVWLALLWIFPVLAGLEPMPSFALASVIAIAATVAAGLWLPRAGGRGGGGEAGGAGGARERLQIGPLGAALATLAAVALLAWTIFVLASA